MRDLLLVALVTIIFAAASIRFDFGERLAAWTGDREPYQLDEIPAILLVSACGLAWFAARRARATQRELGRRRDAEHRLALALAENQRLAHAMAEVQEDERRHIARELHDGLGQSLNAIKADATCIRNELAPSQAASRASADAIVTVVDDMEASVRDLVRRLRPPGLDEFGLAGAIEDCIDGWRRRLPGTAIELAIDGDVDTLGEPANIALYRIVQEGLNNVARHARATHVRVRLARDITNGGRAVALSIEDDGTLREAVPSGGLGLLGMRERVEALGGQFSAEALAPRGFLLRATLCGASPARPAREGVA